MIAALDNNVYEYTFTVFIPTFNRAHTLGRAFKSIASQTFTDLEVVVIDDGSTDNTASVVAEWRKKAPFPIHYHWQENKGKNRAHNRALNYAKGAFFVLLDSDDMLHPKALERLKSSWDAIPDDKKERFAGVEGLCVDFEGSISGDRFPAKVIDSDYLEITKKYNVKGEKKNAIRTDILRQFPYPSFPGERHIRDDIIWKRISHHYRFRYINEVIQIIEYQPDGLSSDVFSLRMSNPQGFRHCFLEEINRNTALTRKHLLFKYHSKFVRYSLHCNIGFFQQCREVNSPFLWLLSIPKGVAGWLEDRVRFFFRKV